MTMYVRRDWKDLCNVGLGVKIDGKLYEIEYVVSPFTFGPIDCDDVCNITASFGEYDLETADDVSAPAVVQPSDVLAKLGQSIEDACDNIRDAQDYFLDIAKEAK
jgi:hypothetical protein